MVDPEKPEKDKESFLKKLAADERFRKSTDFVVDRRVEFVSGALMLVGIILSFFYIHMGGILVGLAFGLCFFEELLAYFLQFGGRYSEQGLFKTLMSIGTVIFFLFAIPTFILAAAVGFGIMYFLRVFLKK